MSTLIQSLAAPARRPGLLQRLRRHLAQLDAAHDYLARYAALEEAARDSGLSPDILLGASPQQGPALPFFFQRRPGRE